MLRFDVITIFPRMYEGFLGESILKIAQDKGAVAVHLTDLREFTEDRHRSVDDRPYGGGPGMVMKVGPVVRAVRALREAGEPDRLILTTPQGRCYDQRMAAELARERRLILIAGHYGGYDERIRTILRPEEISCGDYVLTGGELPALAIIDSVTRLLPGVLGSAESLRDESFSTRGRLDHPHYTRPAVFEGHEVPAVLRSGDHEKVRAWREQQALERTRERRPDMLASGQRSAVGSRPCDGQH